MTRAWPRPRQSVVVTVIRREHGAATCHVSSDADDLAALTREPSKGVEIRAYVYPIEKLEVVR